MTEIPGHRCVQSANHLAALLDEDADGLLEWELKQCPACAARLDELEQWCKELENPMWVVGPEILTAPTLAAELELLPHREQLRRIETDERYHHWGLTQLYLKESERFRFIEARTSFECAEVAVRIVESILAEPGGPYLPELLADLQAKAWAFLANGCRLLRKFGQAEEAFLKADGYAAQGTRSGKVWATVLSLRASLLTDQYRELEASVLLERVAAIYRQAADHPALAKTLLQLSGVRWHLGNVTEAIQLAREALPLLTSEPLRLNTHLNLAAYLMEVGEFDEAARHLARIPATADTAVAVRREWAAAHLAQRTGQLEKARELFAAARRCLAAQERSYEFALASLDLAILEHGCGNTRRVREVLDEALPLLMLEGVSHEVFAPLQLIYEAISKDNLSLELLRSALRRLERLHPR